MKLAKRISKLSIIFLIFLFSCNENPEVEVETFAKIYVDLLVADDYYGDSDSLIIKKEEIFKKYSISKEIYYNTFNKFSYNRDKWDNFFNLANSYLDTLKSEAKSRKSKE